MNGIYLGDCWEGKGRFQVIADFSGVYITEDEYNAEKAPYVNVKYWHERKEEFDKIAGDFDGVEILLAYYTYECYSGDAYVLFRKEGKLFDVEGGHCSCYGLEGQWSPEETTIEALEHRMTNGHLGRSYDGENIFADELSEVIDQIKREEVVK